MALIRGFEMIKIECDYNCGQCNRYTSAIMGGHSDIADVMYEYTCNLTGRVVERHFDEDGNLVKLNVW